MLSDDCLFCKIIKGEIPASKVFEDDKMLIFKDIEPKAKIHYLLVLKDHFGRLNEMDIEQSKTLGECLSKLALMQSSLGIEEGYRLIINQGRNGGQTVEHVHVHILGGEELPF